MYAAATSFADRHMFRVNVVQLLKVVMKAIAIATVSLFVVYHSGALQNNSYSSDSGGGDSSMTRWYTRRRSDNDDIRLHGNRSLPGAVIFGVRKCGTRALLDFMSSHPAIAAAPYEIHYFDRNVGAGLDWYRRQMPLALAHEITMEKTPAYFITPDAPRLMYEMNSQMKLILIVRDPVVRAVSDYTQVWAKRRRDDSGDDDRQNSTTTTMEAFERLALDPLTNSVNLNFKPLWVSVYHHHMRNWLHYFRRRQIHVVDGDVLVRDPSAELAKVEDFLNISRYLTPEKFYYNETKGFYCMRTRSMDRCLGDTKGRKHPTVSAHVLKKLKLFYKQHNRLFFKLIDRSFDW